MRTILTSIHDYFQNMLNGFRSLFQRLGWQGLLVCVLIGVLCGLLTRG